MRHEPTDAERKIWSLLRNGRLAGFKFRRQVPVAGYVLDFYCIAGRLVVELDGGQHNTPQQAAYDQRRTQALQALGITVLRFWDHDVLKHADAVARTIYSHLEASERPSPHPSPGVPGEGARTSTETR
jgi:adenine-specific DNA-methyltransferase